MTGSSRAVSWSRPTTPMSAPTWRSSPPKCPATSPRSRSPQNQAVHAGDLLVQIDDGDYSLWSTAAKDKIATQDATIARIGRQVEAQSAVIAQAQAQIAAAHAQLARAPKPISSAPRSNSTARRSSPQTNFGSQQRLEQAAADRARTAAALTGSGASAGRGARRRSTGAKRQSRRAAGAEARGGAHARRTRQYRAREGRARPLLHRRSARRSTASSATGRRSSGEYVQPGTRLLALVPLDQRLCRRQFQGDAARLDPSRPEGRRRGRSPRRARRSRASVKSVAPASGSQFSLLPPDNATGNFTKVVQRVAVRIELSAGSDPGGRACVPACRSSPRCARATKACPSRRCSARWASSVGEGARKAPSRERGRERAGYAGAVRAPPRRRSERFDKRKLIAFIFMVFGMFMAILDIQIVSASLSRDPGGPVGVVRTRSPGSRPAI